MSLATKHPRIAVTADPALSDALERVRPLFAGQPVSRVVHDLAIKGAEAVLEAEEMRAQAIERLIHLTGPESPLDWDWLLENRDRLWLRD